MTLLAIALSFDLGYTSRGVIYTKKLKFSPRQFHKTISSVICAATGILS